MEERRELPRINYKAKAILVLYETGCPLYADIINLNPLGMGLVMNETAPDILGCDVLVVSDTSLVYSTIIRQKKRPDGTYEIGTKNKKFDKKTKQYLFDKFREDLGKRNI